MTCESKNNAHLLNPLGATFIRLNELGTYVVKITRLMSIFTSKKVYNFWKKKSADKIWSKKDKGMKVSPPMPNRVKEKTLWQCLGVDQGYLLRGFVNWSGAASFDKSFSIFFLYFFNLKQKTAFTNNVWINGFQLEQKSYLKTCNVKQFCYVINCVLLSREYK